MIHKLKPSYIVSALLTLIFCMVPTISWSRGGPPPDPSAMIEQMDADGDGKLSAEEFKGPEDLFTRIDADGDGYLTSDEMEAGRPGPPDGGNRFDQDDVDGDGMVSEAEFSGPADLFANMDADGDGYLTRDEAAPPKMGRGGPGPMGQSDDEE